MQRVKITVVLVYRGFLSLPIQARIFTFLGLSFGLLFIVASAPFQGPDEPQHYYRIYSLATNGRVIAQHFENNGRYGDVVPVPVLRMVQENTSGTAPTGRPDRQNIAKYFHNQPSADRQAAYFENTAIYPPTSYIPQVLGVLTGKILGMPLMPQMYLARLFNLLAWVALITVALTCLPFGRWAILVIALLPMSLYQASSLSPDALVNALTILAVALILKLSQTRRMTRINVVALTVTLVLLGVGKQVYFLLAMPFVYAAALAKGLRGRNIALSVGISILALLAVICWNILVSDATKHIPQVLREGANIAIGAQLDFILHHPLRYFQIILYTLFIDSYTLLFTTGVGVFGGIDIGLPAYCYTLTPILFMLAIMQDGTKRLPSFLTSRLRVLLIATSVLLTLLICTALYLGYTTVGNKRIEGLQGRYFIPPLVVLVPALVSRSFSARIPERRFVIGFFVVVVFILSSALFVLLDANYLRIVYHTP